MEAKELMIEDLVTYKGSLYKVDSLYRSNVFVGLFPCNVKKDDKYLVPVNAMLNEVYPIQVTPEILEKDGWKLDEEMSGDDPCFVLDLSNEDPNWMRNLYWSNDVLYLGDYHYCDCFNVHQLQHALRLLGKDNHADNFKV